jgi:hypothetical protein
MNTIKSFMLNHPLLSVVIILPFTMVFTMAIFSLIINILLPGLLALWLAGWVYTSIVGQHWRKNINEPFWFIRVS